MTSCSLRTRVLSWLSLVLAVVYAVMLFHPVLGDYLAKAAIAVLVLVAGWFFHESLSLRCTRVEAGEEEKKRILGAPIG
ncbi:MAG: hypothetical protein ABWW69_02300 [Pyrodictiaceae archaeon]